MSLCAYKLFEFTVPHLIYLSTLASKYQRVFFFALFSKQKTLLSVFALHAFILIWIL